MTQVRVAPDQAPPAPAPPAAKIAQDAAANVVSTQQLTSRDIAALRARRSALSDQLKNVTDRRHEVQNILRSATTPADKAGLEQRLSYLDGRITRIEAEIDQNSSQLTSLEAMRATTSGGSTRVNNPNRGDRMDGNMVPIAICFILFVLSPIALTASRYLWKRSSAPKVVNNPESAERMLRMEQAIDSIAIEIERVSEGQRFVTRLLAEGRSPVQVGAAQPVAEAIPVGAERYGAKR
jgi:hypothetical protein